MNWISKGIDKVKGFVSGITSVASRVNYSWMGNTIHGQLSNTKDFIHKAYKLNADVYSITSFIAGKCATVPFVLYEVIDEKSLMKYKSLTNGSQSQSANILRTKALKQVDRDHRITKMLNKAPNEFMTASEFKYGFVLYRLLTGNSFVRGFAPETDPGKFMEMFILPSQETVPMGGGQYNAVRAYKMTWDPTEIAATEVSHSRYFNPDFEFPGNPFILGLSPLQAGANAVLRSNSAYEASTKAFQNGGMAGILFQDGGADLTEPQRQGLQDHIDAKVAGSGNYKQILAASSKMGWLKIGESPVDLGVIESLNMDLRTLCNLYHVNSAIFNDPTNKAYNNVSEARKAAITDAVLPELTAMRDAFNLWLVPGWEKADNKRYFLDYDASVFPEMQANMAETATWLSAAWWLTPNEKRAQQDYDILGPEYDVPFLPVGIAPLGSGNTEDDEDFNKAYKAVGDIDYPGDTE